MGCFLFWWGVFDDLPAVLEGVFAENWIWVGGDWFLRPLEEGDIVMGIGVGPGFGEVDALGA
jgi:hypothetical protein